ncbi:MAG TPA: DUF2284 domain-containing protein [Methylomusa anaerophila]|uniref:Metal-binding protein n=1 Tax=Methylomusa anaerophila TaxID=1930071 RepID=A0A348AJ56_9FIRM|nr:DUF2284 domain-containing protein [Methylomusa anaerophila]BBB91104.1 hypothetical protein MAMMFC1_01773 [Methylomusa anaerophila]HML88981.1 DUF2284 domain-containing protein [Methylomusa anaerophila]
MTPDFSELVQEALAYKADYAAIVKSEQIKFVADFRKACEQNSCGKYNKNWMCPPAVGPLEELKERAGRFRQGLLFQTVHTIKSSFDWKGMMAAAKIHDGVFRNILGVIKAKYNFAAILPLSAGACIFCDKCAYVEGEPCRFPEQALASVEAYGIDVMNLEKACGIPYYNGKNTVSYVGLILFNTNEL